MLTMYKEHYFYSNVIPKFYVDALDDAKVMATQKCMLVHMVAFQYNTIQYNTIQYNTIQYNTIQYNTIQYNTIQYNTIQYNTIQGRVQYQLCLQEK